MFGVLLLALLKLALRCAYDMRIVRHPVTLVVFFSLLWMFFTSMTSELPVVSFKYLLSRLWFVVPFYFLGILLFKRFKNIKTFNWLYIIPLIYVIIHTTRVHAAHGFSEDVSHRAMSPFYNDHTAYGAILALLLPFTLVSTFFKRYPVKYRVVAGVVSFILLVALFLSNSRAAWLSFIGAFGVLMFILLKIRFRYVFLVLAVLVGLFYSFKPQIIDYLEDNKQDSSGDFKEHVQSMYNISTDALNLERLNRWQSALRLFEERPVMGWGPGTYQFVYAPFQRSKEKTIISTNFGDMECTQ
ncbi:MAG: O-antigen ligase family protein [Bacteroidales bacterium]|nr:O-antigen ligase family protein [Bacteroidales bacterium]